MSTKNEVFFGAVKGVIISLIFTLISILVFALILKIFSLNNNVIKPINYVIKVTAVFLGTFIAVKEEKGILKGFIIGVSIIFILFLLFSLLSLNFNFNLSFIWDLLLGGGVGALTGVIAVNKKK